MPYYCFDNNDNISVITEDFSKTFGDKCICSELIIPFENVKYVSGVMYDDRTLEYAKIKKINDLYARIINMINGGYITSMGIKAACTQEDINAFAAKQVHVDNTPDVSVDIYDYYGTKQTLTQPNYLIFCYELGNYFSSIIYKRNDTLKLIEDATTIEQVQAIII